MKNILKLFSPVRFMFKNIAIAAIFFLANPVSAEGLGIEGTRVEVDKFMDSVMEGVGARDVELFADKVLKAPIYMATPNGVQVFETRDSVVGLLRDNFYPSLDKVNHIRTEIVSNNTCVLTENSAIWSGVLARINTEEVVYAELPTTVTLLKTNDSWQIITWIPGGKGVSCEM